MLQLLVLIMGEDVLNQCRSEGLSCSSVPRANGAWHSVGLAPTGLTQVDVDCQEQSETVPVLTIKAATNCFLNMMHKVCAWIISECLWLYVLLVGLGVIELFCAAG